MENELYHYGIKGMRWGVRRSEAQLARGRKKNWSEDARAASTLKKKNINKLSNSELRKVNERIRLEQEYSKLNPNLVQKGLKVAAATAGTMGTMMALYNNGGQLISIGKKVASKLK